MPSHFFFFWKNDIQQIFPFTSLCVFGKNRLPAANRPLALTRYHNHLSPGWENESKRKKRTRKCLKFDELHFLHKSALFTHLPLTTGVRGVCESFLPLCALQEIYCLKRFLVRRYAQGTHTVYWQKKKKKKKCVHYITPTNYDVRNYMRIFTTVWWGRLDVNTHAVIQKPCGTTSSKQ